MNSLSKLTVTDIHTEIIIANIEGTEYRILPSSGLCYGCSFRSAGMMNCPKVTLRTRYDTPQLLCQSVYSKSGKRENVIFRLAVESDVPSVFIETPVYEQAVENI